MDQQNTEVRKEARTDGRADRTDTVVSVGWNRRRCSRFFLLRVHTIATRRKPPRRHKPPASYTKAVTSLLIIKLQQNTVANALSILQCGAVEYIRRRLVDRRGKRQTGGEVGKTACETFSTIVPELDALMKLVGVMLCAG